MRSEIILFILIFHILLLVQNGNSSQFCSYKSLSSDVVKDLYVIVGNEQNDSDIKQIEFPSFILSKVDLPVKLMTGQVCIPLDTELLHYNDHSDRPKFKRDTTITYDYSCKVYNPSYIHQIFHQPIRITTNSDKLIDDCSCTSDFEIIPSNNTNNNNIGNNGKGRFIAGVEVSLIGYSNRFIYINAMVYHYTFGQCHIKTLYRDDPIKQDDTFIQKLILIEETDHTMEWAFGAVAITLTSIILICCLYYFIKDKLSKKNQYVPISNSYDRYYS